MHAAVSPSECKVWPSVCSVCVCTWHHVDALWTHWVHIAPFYKIAIMMLYNYVLLTKMSNNTLIPNLFHLWFFIEVLFIHYGSYIHTVCLLACWPVLITSYTLFQTHMWAQWEVTPTSASCYQTTTCFATQCKASVALSLTWSATKTSTWMPCLSWREECNLDWFTRYCDVEQLLQCHQDQVWGFKQANSHGRWNHYSC